MVAKYVTFGVRKSCVYWCFFDLRQAAFSALAFGFQLSPTFQGYQDVV